MNGEEFESNVAMAVLRCEQAKASFVKIADRIYPRMLDEDTRQGWALSLIAAKGELESALSFIERLREMMMGSAAK